MEAKRDAIISTVMNLIQAKAEGKLDTLYTLSDIATTREWNYELPTLTQKGRFTFRQSWNSSDEFQATLFGAFPIFRHIDLSNIAMMGGAVFSLLHSENFHSHSVKDIDLFLCGDIFTEEGSDEAIVARAESFIDGVFSYLEYAAKEQAHQNSKAAGLPIRRISRRDHIFDRDRERSRSRDRSPIFPVPPGVGRSGRNPAAQDPESEYKSIYTSLVNQFSATRNGSVITFNIPLVSCPVQLVLAPNTSLQRLLQRVDLDCTAIAWYNNTLCFNAFSKFCYENACFIVGNMKGRQFEDRILKYFNKGMDVILPYLDLTKIPSKNLKYGIQEVIDLNQMAVVYSEVAGCKIYTSDIIPTVPLGSSNEEEEEQGNNDSGAGPSVVRAGYTATRSMNRKNNGTIIHENIIHLNHGRRECFQYYGEGKFIKDVLLSIPKMTDRMITNTFETVKDRLSQNGNNRSFRGSSFLANNSNGLEISTLESYFTVRKTSEIVSDIVVNKLLEKEAKMASSEPTYGRSSKPLTLYTEQYSHFLASYYAQLVALQIRETNAKLDELKQEYQSHPERFRIVASTTFDATTFDLQKWYGNYFLETNR